MFGFRRLPALLLAAMLACFPSVAPAQSGCASRAEGRQLLEQGQVVPLPEAMRRAGLPSGAVVDAQLCREGGGYVYRVRVRQNGNVRQAKIPAG